MSLTFEPVPVPLHTDSHGTVRVGGTRVTLQTLLASFLDGATPEQIIQDFDTLKLADVYTVIAYYLTNRAAVDAYLEDQRKQGESVRRKMEAVFDQAGLKERLLARRKEKA
jgi:uncharacterized protein (DUF433 family)